MMIAAAIGAVLTSLIIIAIQGHYDMSKEQLHVFWKINQAHSSAVTIQYAMKYFISKKKYYMVKL